MRLATSPNCDQFFPLASDLLVFPSPVQRAPSASFVLMAMSRRDHLLLYSPVQAQDGVVERCAGSLKGLGHPLTTGHGNHEAQVDGQAEGIAGWTWEQRKAVVSTRRSTRPE